MGPHLVQKFPTLYGIQRVVTILTGVQFSVTCCNAANKYSGILGILCEGCYLRLPDFRKVGCPVDLFSPPP